MKVIITNKMEQMIDEYKERTGIDKVVIAERMGLTKQNLNILIHGTNPTAKSLIKLAHVLGCKPFDLLDYEIVE